MMKIKFYFFKSTKVRFFSDYSPFNGTNPITPIIVYEDADKDKSKILKENKEKSLIYRWVNKINYKTYVGSSINLTVRMYKYYSLKQLENSKSAIYKALLKYGYSNFRLEILEYCEIKYLISREQYFIDTLKPEYNLAKRAGSTLGYKFSEETLEILRNKRKYILEISDETRKKLSKSATGRILTPEEREKISNWHKGKIVSDETKRKISEARTKLSGVPVVAKNIITNEILEFDNLTLAASNLKVSRTSIKKALDTKNLIKKTFEITRWQRHEDI